MYLTEQQLHEIGFGHVGDNVLISDKASIYNAKNIHIGDHVRIDDFAVLSAGKGGIHLDGHNHISTHAVLLGEGEIHLGMFVNISIKATVLSSSNDFTGKYPAGWMIPKERQNIDISDVHIDDYCTVAAHSVVLPGTIIYPNTVLGACSLAKGTLIGNSIYVGVPATRVKSREIQGMKTAQSYL